MIDERSTKRYTETKDANHDLVTKSFLKKFADKSKNIFRAELFDCENYGNLTIVTNVKYVQRGFEPKTYIIDIKDSDTYDTTITWNIYADDETKEQKISVHVLCKGDPTPIHICKYEKEDAYYYTFIVETTGGKLVTVDVTELNQKKNNIEQWNVYPSNGILYEQDEDKVWLTNNIKDSIYLLQGEGTQESPYEEDLKYLGCDEFSLDGYTELGTTAYNEKLYVKGDIPEQKYFNGNLIESVSDILVTGIKFELVKYIYYKNDLIEEFLESYVDTDSFTTSLKQLEACLKYYSFKDIDVDSKNYNDLDESQETSIKDCLISEVNNTFDVLPGVFDSTRALLAKESDHSKESDHTIESDHSVTSDYFKEEKLINLQTDDFLTYSEESFSTDFSDTTNIPRLSFQGSNLQNIEEDKFYNNVKVNRLGLIVEANNIDMPSGLPYEKEYDNLYFRIDPEKSIDDNKKLKISFSEGMNDLVLTINKGSMSDNVMRIATITNNSGKDKKIKFLSFNSFGSNIISPDTALNTLLMIGSTSGDYTLTMGPNKDNRDYLGIWHVKNNTGGAGGNMYNTEGSYIHFFDSNTNVDTHEYINDNEVTCYYQWREITIPTGTTNVYIDLTDQPVIHDSSNPNFSINENLNSGYIYYFNKIMREDPYLIVPYSGKLIILGNDGLMISSGNVTYKIQITENGEITSGQTTE